MSEFFSNFRDSINKAAEETLNNAIGKSLITLGTNVENIAMIAIILGALLLICRYTKVLRWGCISYLLGLLIEIIGISMIK